MGPVMNQVWNITNGDIVGRLRDAAISIRLDPDKLSAKSMRVTYSTVGWVAGSNVASVMYNKAASIRNTAALSLDDNLNTAADKRT